MPIRKIKDLNLPDKSWTGQTKPPAKEGIMIDASFGEKKHYFYFEDISALMSQTPAAGQNPPVAIALRYIEENGKYYPVLVAVSDIDNPPQIPSPGNPVEPEASNYLDEDEHFVVLSCPPHSQPALVIIT